MILKESYIKQLSNGEWQVLSRKGKNLGTYDSKSAAKKRLAQIEMFKHINKKRKRKKRKKSFQQLDLFKNAQIEVVNTYSSVMRELNENSPEKLKDFMISFKKTFDRAILESLDDPTGIAMIQAMRDINYIIEASEQEKRLVKIAQTVMELGSPAIAGKAIANVIKFLVRKMPDSTRNSSLSSIKQRVSNLNEREIAGKKTPASASIGQSIAFIKNMLGGHPPEYIRSILKSTISNL